MNILFVASDNNYTSGAFLSMVKLGQLLVSEHQVNTFVVLPNEGDGDRLLMEAGIPFEIVYSRNWVVDIEEGKTKEREKRKAFELLGNEGAIDRIHEIIIEREIDILHINTSYSYVGACAAIRANIPFVWHIREFLEEDQHRKIWDREKGYQLMQRADAIVTISNSIYQKYVNLLVPEKMHIIHNGIDEKLFYNPDKKIFQEPIVRFGIVGGVVPHKGQEELLKACGMLKRSGFSDFELKIVGKGKGQYIDYLKNLVMKEDLQEHVIFVGPSDDIPSVLNDMDMLFVCSKNEAFGRITVEGMMAGCLVIGADTAGTTEILKNGKNGYLYKHGDATDLVEKIINALGNRAEAECIRKIGQKEALNCYLASKNAKKICDMYKDIVGENLRGSEK